MPSNNCEWPLIWRFICSQKKYRLSIAFSASDKNCQLIWQQKKRKKGKSRDSEKEEYKDGKKEATDRKTVKGGQRAIVTEKAKRK